MKNRYEESELIMNPDGSIYHLHMKPEDVGDYVLLAGDPGRIRMIAAYFDEIHSERHNREFLSVNGRVGRHKVTALSTGIGTDNIDIVVNELDALVNIDLETRTDSQVRRKLKLIRIGTSGAIQSDIKPGSVVASSRVIGFDGLLNFYRERDRVCLPDLEKRFMEITGWPGRLAAPYAVAADESLLNAFAADYRQGITISSNGFYAPQGRQLRASLMYPELFASLHQFEHEGLSITNFEMEGSAIYGLSRILGHQALTLCLIIANRKAGTFAGDYSGSMHKLIERTLSAIRDDE